ncbi:MAG: polyprenyl synthetase family protein [Opitutaceae bacterium]
MLASDKASQTTVRPEDLSALFANLEPHFSGLDRFMAGQVSQFEPEIRELVSYCLQSGGKRIRPALVFLAGWQCPDEAFPDLIQLAAVIEMVHLATLVHDDIMDEASLRRNRSTAAKRFGPHTSVLLGDALFAHAVQMATGFPTTMVCRQVSLSTRKVCAGEIMQTLEQRHGRPTLEAYHRVIDLKTAELFHLSCHLGATLAHSSPGFAEAAGCFGRHLGVAYQVYDDLADFFGTETRIGKTLGTDFAQGKCTLPLLVLLDRLDQSDAQTLLKELRGNENSHFGRRVAQMDELGVFEEVSHTIRNEIHAAEVLLQPFKRLPAARELLRFSGILRVQLDSLRSE